MSRNRRMGAFPAVFLALMMVTGSAYAYVGPGAGLSAIGSFFAAVLAVLLAIVGFLWYPIKRLIKKYKKKKADKDGAGE